MIKSLFSGLSWTFCHIYRCCSVFGHIQIHVVFNNRYSVLIALWMSFFDVGRVLLSKIWYWDLWKAPQWISWWQRFTLPVSYWSALFSPMLAFVKPSAYSRRLEPSVWIISIKTLFLKRPCPKLLFRWHYLPQLKYLTFLLFFRLLEINIPTQVSIYY